MFSTSLFYRIAPSRLVSNLIFLAITRPPLFADYTNFLISGSVKYGRFYFLQAIE